MPFSEYLGDEILDWVLGTDMDTAPSNIYVALWNGNPTADGSGGTELTSTITGAATRTEVTSLGAISTSGNYRQTTTGSATQITASASGAATANYITLWDASTAGNLLYFESTTSTDIAAGAEVNLDAGNLTVRSKIA
tara:strand:- start:95 stop:508 length:414 start_codon:yes stop_codon:yes gene_type:complete